MIVMRHFPTLVKLAILKRQVLLHCFQNVGLKIISIDISKQDIKVVSRRKYGITLKYLPLNQRSRDGYVLRSGHQIFK